MISWSRINENQWIFEYEFIPLELNSFRELVVCSQEAGIPWEEMKAAAEEMDKNGHNYAQFGGIRKSFIFTDVR